MVIWHRIENFAWTERRLLVSETEDQHLPPNTKTNTNFETTRIKVGTRPGPSR